MSKLVNLQEIQIAKEVIKDVPNIIEILDKAQEALYNYKQYKEVGLLDYHLNDTKFALELTLYHYKKIYKDGVK